VKILYIDYNDITKHVVLQDVTEHVVDKFKKKYIACLVPLCWVNWGGGLYCLYIPWLWSRFGTVPCLIFVFMTFFFLKCVCASLT